MFDVTMSHLGCVEVRMRVCAWYVCECVCPCLWLCLSSQTKQREREKENM